MVSISFFNYGINCLDSAFKIGLAADRNSPYATLSAVVIKTFQLMSYFKLAYSNSIYFEEKSASVLKDVNNKEFLNNVPHILNLLFIGFIRSLYYSGALSLETTSRMERLNVGIFLLDCLCKQEFFGGDSGFSFKDFPLDTKINVIANAAYVVAPVFGSSTLVKVAEIFLCMSSLFPRAYDCYRVLTSKEKSWYFTEINLNYDRKFAVASHFIMNTIFHVKLMKLGFHS